MLATMLSIVIYSIFQGLFQPHVKLMFERCPDLPNILAAPQAITVGGDVYISGVDNYRNYVIFRYSLIHSSWNQVPSPPVGGGGLAHLSTKLVSVGGYDRKNKRAVKSVYRFDRNSYSPLSSMSTARAFPKCVSYRSSIIAFGGLGDCDLPVQTIEVYSRKNDQWELAEGVLPWPVALNITSTTLVRDTCYFLGTTASKWREKVSLKNFVPADKILVVPLSSLPHFPTTTFSVLLDTPHCTSVATTLCGSLLSLGGGETHDEQRMIHLYSPLIDSWAHIGNSPVALWSLASVAVEISDAEVLIVQTEHCKVYKCVVCE